MGIPRQDSNELYARMLRRQSMPLTREFTKSTSSEEEEEEVLGDDKEIFIDFKPYISPRPSPKFRKKRLHKTCSDGEMLLDRHREKDDEIAVSSDGETGNVRTNGILLEENGKIEVPRQIYLSLPSNSDSEGMHLQKQKILMTKKRSMSLDENEYNLDSYATKSTLSSPGQDDQKALKSDYASSDSLATDVTKDHSDGMWNESQATVLQNDLLTPESAQILTPATKRKNLLLQHQQRSSIDTEALDIEEQGEVVAHKISKPAATQTTTALPDLTYVTVPPKIAVTATSSTEAESQSQEGRTSRRMSLHR